MKPGFRLANDRASRFCNAITPDCIFPHSGAELRSEKIINKQECLFYVSAILHRQATLKTSLLKNVKNSYIFSGTETIAIGMSLSGKL